MDKDVSEFKFFATGNVRRRMMIGEWTRKPAYVAWCCSINYSKAISLIRPRNLLHISLKNEILLFWPLVSIYKTNIILNNFGCQICMEKQATINIFKKVYNAMSPLTFSNQKHFLFKYCFKFLKYPIAKESATAKTSILYYCFLWMWLVLFSF